MRIDKVRCNLYVEAEDFSPSNGCHCFTEEELIPTSETGEKRNLSCLGQLLAIHKEIVMHLIIIDV